MNGSELASVMLAFSYAGLCVGLVFYLIEVFTDED
jgi:xanthosine utilization system XapX-like protein